MKKSLVLPIAVSAAVTVAYVICTFLFVQGLPEHLATHFDATGRPNGWMTKAATIRFNLGMGLGTQAFFGLLVFFTRFVPARFLNLPNKEYWQKPEHYPQARAYMTRYLLWLGSLMMIWMILLNYHVAECNRTLLPRFNTDGFVVAMGTFMVMLLVWFICIWREFRVPVNAKGKA